MTRLKVNGLPDAELLAAVRTWLREHQAERHDASWFELLGESGLATPAWPEALGGLGLGTAQAAMVLEEVSNGGVARPHNDFVSLKLVAPTLLVWATEEQKGRFLPGIRTGRDRWCQLFSEPGAGSDLASIETRARHDGQRWVVNGQKVWSSFAHESQWGILLVRTEDIPRHGGLTFFVIDMDQPGIEIKPLIQMNGGTEFNEVFFDDVIVEDRDMIGGRGEGWKVAQTALQSERSGLAGSVVVGPGEADRLVERAIATERWDNPGLRARLSRLVVEERVHQMNMLRASTEGARPPFPSVLKLFHSELHERLSRAAADVDPLGATAWTSGASELATEFLSAKYLTIPGGTSEIQRNLIAERVLGQPRDLHPR